MTVLRNAPHGTGIGANAEPGPRRGEWRSWHLHTATFAAPAVDDVVTQVLGPVAARLGLLDPDGPAWFFLRYWQGGPHVRLRIAGLTTAEAATVESEAADRLHALDALVPEARRLNQASYEHAVHPIAVAGEQGIPLRPGELVTPGIHRAVYEPEYDRYGGQHLIGRSEHLFHSSSRTALRVCLARAGVRHATLSGLEAMAAACSVLAEPRSPVDRIRFLQAQRDQWTGWTRSADPVDSDTVAEHRRQLINTARASVASLDRLGPQLRATLERGDPRWSDWTTPLADALADWAAELGPARAAEILGSHVHMTANRLGVAFGREADIAAVLLALLE